MSDQDGPAAPCDDIDDFALLIWDSLNRDNRVSLFVRYIDIETGIAESRIINVNK